MPDKRQHTHIPPGSPSQRNMNLFHRISTPWAAVWTVPKPAWWSLREDVLLLCHGATHTASRPSGICYTCCIPSNGNHHYSGHFQIDWRIVCCWMLVEFLPTLKAILVLFQAERFYKLRIPSTCYKARFKSRWVDLGSRKLSWSRVSFNVAYSSARHHNRLGSWNNKTVLSGLKSKQKTPFHLFLKAVIT